ncbi:TPA: energy-coupling factor transporter transmembrane protein EcfT [Candidatus Bathyarchaeota archaeon]|nr:energy-coupling factor transporter transmembrane protein EcfT [Candidatus Bathyarchaeota archaeon]
MKFAEYVEGDSAIHRLDPRSKITLCATFILAAFTLNHPIFMLALFLLVLLLSRVARIHREFFAQTKTLFSVVVMAFLLWSFFYRWSLFAAVSPSRVIFKAGPLVLDELGLLYGITMPLRVLILIGAPLLVIMTTPFSDITYSLTKLGLPYKIAFTTGLSLRLIPTLSEEMVTIRQAQTARGLELEGGGLIDRVRAHVPVLIPLMVRAIGLADRMSLAMEARGFEAYPTRTSYRELKMGRGDYSVTALSIVFIAVCLWLRVSGIGVVA